ARRMNVGRGVISVLVGELIADGLIYEGATGEAARGRKPTFLHIRTQDRIIVAVDLRFSRTSLLLTDFGGRQLDLEVFETVFAPTQFVAYLAERVHQLLVKHDAVARCEGVGISVPGIVDHRTGRVLNAPALGWRNVDLRDEFAARTGLTVQVENAAKACAVAQMWHGRSDPVGGQNFAFINISDGVGVGLVVNGELVRGRGNMAGEFGHNPLSLDGPRCMCGASGCWEAYISNIATLSRFCGRDLSKIGSKALMEAGSQTAGELTVEDLIELADGGEARALAAIQTTGRYLGLGLAGVINALNPARVYLSGEITGAWHLIETTVRMALSERALTSGAAETKLLIEPHADHPRLRGAAALVAAPTFAAPRVA
ncbi:MAG TPA: ROK family protein, partial [Pyrinomonadaceae bacterium]|nr:ROK family protein [Pyrinomonadaceae bacterium]